jgi:hypothetical protein
MRQQLPERRRAKCRLLCRDAERRIELIAIRRHRHDGEDLLGDRREPPALAGLVRRAARRIDRAIAAVEQDAIALGDQHLAGQLVLRSGLVRPLLHRSY